LPSGEHPITIAALLGEALALGGAFDPLAVLTPQIVGALVGLAALSLAAIPLKARFARN